MPTINNTVLSQQQVEDLLALPQLTACGTGIDGETDIVVNDGVDHWKIRTVTNGDNVHVNDAQRVQMTGQINAIQSYTPVS